MVEGRGRNYPCEPVFMCQNDGNFPDMYQMHILNFFLLLPISAIFFELLLISCAIGDYVCSVVKCCVRDVVCART